MLERLYCPDFTPVFGAQYRFPHDFPQVDALVWPLFEDYDFPESVHALLDLARDGHPLWYRRHVALGEFALEQDRAGVGRSLLQAFEPGQRHAWRIPNDLVLEACAVSQHHFQPVLSVDYADVSAVTAYTRTLQALDVDKKVRVAATAIYPTFVQAPLMWNPRAGADADESRGLRELAHFHLRAGVPLKIDVGSLPLPGNDQARVTPALVGQLAQFVPGLRIIVAGADVGANLAGYAAMMRHAPNVALELDPRAIGGLSPTAFFQQVLALPGLVNNCWDRLLLGSATPTLELPQVARGWWEATADLSLAQRHLTRIWGFRNAHRWYRLLTPRAPYSGALERPPAWDLGPPTVRGATGPRRRVLFPVTVESSAITQLVWLQPALREIEKTLAHEHAAYPEGELILRTNHTTASLLVNEHEPGNFLQLHYEFVERSQADPGASLHTVAAAENRPDFNFPDHLLASSVGQRTIIIPVHEGRLLMGRREHLYLLATFGPRRLSVTAIARLEQF